MARELTSGEMAESLKETMLMIESKAWVSIYGLMVGPTMVIGTKESSMEPVIT